MSLIDALGLAGGVGWTATYLTILYVSWRDRTYAMPMLAMVANITWEFLFTFVYPMVGGTVQEVVNIAWLGLDALILVTFLRLWRSDFPQQLQPYMLPILVSCFAAVAALMLATIQLFGKDYGAAYTAFSDNLLMSALFLVMLLRRGNTRGQSIWIAIFKMLGTGVTSVAQYLYDPKTMVLNVLYVEIFLLDMLYIWLLLRAPRWRESPDKS